MSANLSNVTAQIVLSLPHCTYFHDFVGGEIWILCVRSYLDKVKLDILMMASRLPSRKRKYVRLLVTTLFRHDWVE